MRDYDNCEICAKNGWQRNTRKVAITHINEAFNEKVQIDLFFALLKGNRYTVMLMTEKA